MVGAQLIGRVDARAATVRACEAGRGLTVDASESLEAAVSGVGRRCRIVCACALNSGYGTEGWTQRLRLHPPTPTDEGIQQSEKEKKAWLGSAPTADGATDARRRRATPIYHTCDPVAS
jgi:hypothetical protein